MMILRMPDVKAKTGHRSHSSIYDLIKDGLFTKPVHIGKRGVGWPDKELDAINAARVAGKSAAEIRELVIQLHKQRTHTV